MSDHSPQLKRLSTVETAHRLGTSEGTVRSLIARNPALAVRDGRRWLLNSETVERIAAARRLLSLD